MDGDEDLSALLPQPPPPRPDRRTTAIDAALQRFDGAPPESVARPAQPPRRSSWRPQLAAFATVALVVMAGVPIWINGNHGFGPAPERQAVPASPSAARTVPTEPARQAEGARPIARAAPAGAVKSSAEAPPPVAPAAPVLAPSAPPPPLADAEDAAAAPAASLNRVTTMARAREAKSTAAAQPEQPATEVVVTGSRIQRRDYTSTSPIVTVSSQALASKAERRVAPDACTIEDPREDLERCNRIANRTARGARGRAATELAQGLTSAWSGDTDAAIAAFDRGLKQLPLAILYLNRALAWQRKGDIQRARADFDRAVDRAPDDASIYYFRSRFFQAQGDAVRADDDADRAVELEPDYRRMVR